MSNINLLFLNLYLNFKAVKLLNKTHTSPSIQEKGFHIDFITNLLYRYANTVTIKTDLSKCLIKCYATKIYREEQIHTTSVQDGGMWSASCSLTLTPWKEPLVPLDKRPENGLNTEASRKVSVPVRKQILISQSFTL
jgi:hypothetical protein